MSNKILVTGGAGFIGSFLVDELIKEGNDVRILDSLDSQVHPGGEKPLYINKNAEFMKGDVSNLEDVKKAIEDVEIIFHEAASVGIGQSNYQISKFVKTNSIGTANIFDAVINGNGTSVKKILIPGSNTSYGEGMYKCDKCNIEFHSELRKSEQLIKKEWEIKCPTCSNFTVPIPVKEETDLLCNSVYSITKKNQEELSLFLGEMYGLPVTVLRYFNVFGPRQSLSNPYTGVAAIFLSRIKNNNSPVIYEDGLQTRDFISVHDVVRANILAAQSKNADHEIFNVGSGKPITIKDIAEILASLCGKEIKPVISGKSRKGDIRHCYADNSKIKEKLGFEIKTPFEDGMKELISWSENIESVDKFDVARKELEEKGLA
jgi:dTDP-L-rhamnose 4-epimerase